jgi:protein-disulfide isomerase
MKNLYHITITLLILIFFYSPTRGATILDITEDDFVIGNPDSKITIIEYASLSCSHCANFHNNTLADLKKEYVDTGKVKFVFRNFPFNYPALLGSMVLQCIPKDVKYNHMNALFQFQKNWVVRENNKSKQELFKIMQSGGMTKKEFEACINNRNLEEKILQGVIDAQNEFNIQSTPSFLINGILVEGNKSLKEFRQIIDKILSE